MPIITGNLRDFGLASIATYGAQVVFVPSGPAVTNSHLLAARRITVNTDASGAFSVELVRNDATRPPTWYSVEIRWLDAVDGFTAVEFPEFRLVVGEAGGALVDLVDTAPNPAVWWVSASPPPEHLLRPGLIWVYTGPNTSTRRNGDVERWV